MKEEMLACFHRLSGYLFHTSVTTTLYKNSDDELTIRFKSSENAGSPIKVTIDTKPKKSQKCACVVWLNDN